jgi:hypothetical protein
MITSLPTFARRPSVIPVGPLSLDSKIDSGVFDIASSSVVGNDVNITPKIYATSWQTYGCRVHGVRGKTPVFNVSRPNRINSTSSSLHWGCWGYNLDSDDWSVFDSVSYTTPLVTQSRNAPFVYDRVFVFDHPPYPWKRTVRKVQEWIANPLVSSPAGVTDFIVAHTTARNDGLGRWMPALPVYAFQIGTGSGKNTLLWTNGIHSSEAMARRSFEAAVDFALSSDPKAQLLRQYANIIVFPHVHPQGTLGGYYRGGPQSTTDFNRVWDQATPPHETVAWIRDAGISVTGTVIHGFCDFHGFFNTTESTAGLWAATEYLNATFRTTAEQYQPILWTETAASADRIRGWVQSIATTTLVVNVTAEFPAHKSLLMADYHQWGETVAKTFSDMIAAGHFPYGPS